MRVLCPTQRAGLVLRRRLKPRKGPQGDRSNAPPPSRRRRDTQPEATMYAMRSARSFSFLMPAKTILVPGMYFFGFTKYSNMCLSDQVMPEFLFASEYAKPSQLPDWRPMTPQSGGPCLELPPFSMVWHCAHLALKSFAPFFTSPSGTCTSGSGMGIVRGRRGGPGGAEAGAR